MQPYAFSAVEQEVMLARAIIEAARNANQGLVSGFVAAPMSLYDSDNADGLGAYSNRTIHDPTAAPFQSQVDAWGSEGCFAEIGGGPPISVSLSDPLLKPRQGSRTLTIRLRKVAPGLHVVRRVLNQAAPAAATCGDAAASASPGSAAAVGGSGGVLDAAAVATAAAATAGVSSLQQQDVKVVIVATVEVMFPATYPNESCTWRSVHQGTNTLTTLAGGFHRQTHARYPATSPAQGCGGSTSPIAQPSQAAHAVSAPFSAANAPQPANSTSSPQHEVREVAKAAPPPLPAVAPVVYATLQPSAVDGLLTWVVRARGHQQLFLDPTNHDSGATGQQPQSDIWNGNGGGGGRPTPSLPPFLRDFIFLLKCWGAQEVGLAKLTLQQPSLHRASPVGPSAGAAEGPHRGTVSVASAANTSATAGRGSSGGADSSVSMLVSAYNPRCLPPWAGYARALAAVVDHHQQKQQRQSNGSKRPTTARVEACKTAADRCADGSRGSGGNKRTTHERDHRIPNKADSTRRAAAGVASSLATATATAAASGSGPSVTAAGSIGGGQGGAHGTSVGVVGASGPAVAVGTANAAAAASGAVSGVFGSAALGSGGGPGVGASGGLDAPPRWRSLSVGAGSPVGVVGSGNATAAATRPHRVGRGFAACFLPQGGILCWGRVTNLSHKTSAARTPQQRQRSLLPPHVGAFYHALGSASSRGTALLFTSRFSQQRPLPSLLAPALIMQSAAGPGKRCRWSDVHLYLSGDGSAHSALQANAKLCKALRLKAVSNLFATLQRLAKGLVGNTAPAYVSEMLAPVLHQTLTALQAARHPFWAGVAVCCLVLPGALHDRTTTSSAGPAAATFNGEAAFSIAPYVLDKASCITVVSLAERIFGLVGATTRCCEARIARLALESAASSSRPDVSRSGSAIVGRLHMPPGAVRHEPITHCAVCGLSLQRHDRRAARPHSPTDAVEGGQIASWARERRQASSSKPAEGCLVVQCLRCGHGGHVEHIAGWWKDATVRCCPKGCDCVCLY